MTDLQTITVEIIKNLIRNPPNNCGNLLELTNLAMSSARCIIEHTKENNEIDHYAIALDKFNEYLKGKYSYSFDYYCYDRITRT